jgi:hypothetical protein
MFPYFSELNCPRNFYASGWEGDTEAIIKNTGILLNTHELNTI